MTNVEKLIEEVLIAKKNLEATEYSNNLDENGNEVGEYFLDKSRELAATKDNKALLCLLDFFDEDFDLEFGGFLERINNDIFNNYSFKEIIDAMYVKFDQMLNKSMFRAEGIIASLLYYEENYDMFRKMFNTVRAKKSKELLDELESTIDEDYDLTLDEINLLREDMKNWS